MKTLDDLINYLLKEIPEEQRIPIPTNIEEKKKLFRALCNVREPKPVSDEFLKAQDDYLQSELAQKSLTDALTLPAINEDFPNTDGKLSGAARMALWRGDITTLQSDAIVNAANAALLGCFAPLHSCIDNIIHSASGVQLRLECNDLMQKQGHPEPTGTAKITKGYNLPAKYVIHTVGPIIASYPSAQQKKQLADCYRSCLALAKEYNLKSLVFCNISTGVFHFPIDLAAQIAICAVSDFFKENPESILKVIFNVFTYDNYQAYAKIFGDI